MSYSEDGAIWEFHGPAEGTELELPEAGFAGFGICGKRNEWLSQIRYSDVLLEDCGDGRSVGREFCDDGNETSGDGCGPSCELEPHFTCQTVVGRLPETICARTNCGDGIVDEGEACDDGNRVEDDGCSVVCLVEICGDRIAQAGEECDDGNTLGGDGCGPECRVERCGDAVVHEDESCDDGNLFDGDGCSALCALERCGDGLVQAGLGEECDDRNREADDGCTPGCAIERCGDGIRQEIEGCDDGRANSDELPDACRALCLLPYCGDAVVDDGESCDNGAQNSATESNACRPGCVLPSCGDGVLDDSEECDDGNLEAGDRCSPDCLAADFDGDGVRDHLDNCPEVSNADQSDLDRDAEGDVCDLDMDGDGLLNSVEDFDGDGLVGPLETDFRDPDSDDDSLCDGPAEFPIYAEDGSHICDLGEDRNANGRIDLGETSALLIDTDSDCVSDASELFANPPTDPRDPRDRPEPLDSDGDGVGDLCPDEPGPDGIDTRGCPAEVEDVVVEQPETDPELEVVEEAPTEDTGFRLFFCAVGPVRAGPDPAMWLMVSLLLAGRRRTRDA